jgi:glycerol-3-phosphate O-acyltransferase
MRVRIFRNIVLYLCLILTKHPGAMWIRRSFGDDALYQTVVQSYIDTLLTNGYNFECFVEGGRSRTGKLLPPKYGILSYIIDSIASGRVDDAIICPVSTQYDKVIETEYEYPRP